MSIPRIAGSSTRAWAAWPARIFVSSGFTPLALIRTSTWPGAAVGRGTSVSVNGAPGLSRTRARIWLELSVFLLCLGDDGQVGGSVLPLGEEDVVGLFRFWLIAGQGVGTSEPEKGQGVGTADGISDASEASRILK